jgi:ribonuclease BN (tRNA processing enzyme)
VRLVPVGVSGSSPGPASPAACHLLEADAAVGGARRTWRLVLDLGSGAFGPLQALAGPDELDAVALTHLHADHCLDVTALHVAATYGDRRPAGGLDVWGPAGVHERLTRAYEVDPAPGALLEGPLRFRQWAARTPVRIGPFTVVPVPVHHPVPAYGLRVTGPSEAGGAATLAYTGDTDAGPGLLELARGVDLLLTEASGVETHPRAASLRGVHLTGHRAGAAAREAGAARVLLTHVPPWVDPAAVLAEAQQSYGAPERVQLAAPGVVVAL